MRYWPEHEPPVMVNGDNRGRRGDQGAGATLVKVTILYVLM